MSHRYRGAVLIATSLLAPPALAADSAGGGLVGWVESTEGTPIAGALVSVFGKGVRGETLVTLSDSSGQVFLPSLPAGSYTLRALGNGHRPGPAQQVTVMPNRDSVFKMSLEPVGDAGQASPAAGMRDSPADGQDEALRELKWLLRHKRRSVLEDREPAGPPEMPSAAPDEPGTTAADLAERAAGMLPALGATVEIVATPAVFGDEGTATPLDGAPPSQGVLRLKGRMADLGEWNVAGLVSENAGTTWRTAAEVVLTPGAGHRIQAGLGYGLQYLQPPTAASDGVHPPDTRSQAALFVRDRVKATERFTATVGARYSFVGFLQDRSHLDVTAGFEHRIAGRTGLRGSFALRTLAPGGDPLTLSAGGPPQAIVQFDEALRAEHAARAEIGVAHSVGATSLGAYAFHEGVEDQLISVQAEGGRSLRILNGGPLTVRGVGVTLGHRFGGVLNGSVAYVYGHASRELGEGGLAALGFDPAVSVAFREAGYHDVVARVETFIDVTATRLTAYYRINAMSPEGNPGVSARLPTTNTRFDLQLSQGLPFMQSLTRADWQLLLAVRNLFYADLDSGALDEMAVLHPPMRVMGGFAVRF